MPNVRFMPSGREVEVLEGTNLRRAALDAGVPLYAGLSRLLNCGGYGRCTGCMVRVRDGTTGGASPRSLGERLRLLLSRGVCIDEARLACRTEIRGDLVVETGVGTVDGIRAIARWLRRR